MKRIIVIIVLLSMMGGFCACQPTPNSPIVQSKNDGKLEKEIAADEKPAGKYEAPEHWTDNVYSKTDKITIEIDAEISVPDTDMYPVVRIQKYELAKKWVMGLVGRLSTDAKTYSYKNELVLTKPEVAAIIQQLMDDMADPNSNINSTLISAEDRARLKKERDQEIADWQDYYKTAPNSFEAVEIPIAFTDNTFDCGINMGYKEMTELMVMQYGELGGSVVININDGIDTGEIVCYTDDLGSRNNLDLSPDDAVKLGLDFIARLTDGDFTASLIRAGYMRMGERKSDVTDYPECYEICYTRDCEGVSATYWDSNRNSSLINERMNDKLYSASQYAPYYAQESIRLIITDKGVAVAEWVMPTAITDVVNKNVGLLPFDEIQDIFRQQISVEGIRANYYDTNIVSRRVVITKITLGMTQMREKNTYDGLIMVPAWSFFGYEVYKYDGQQAGGYKLDENNEYVNDQLGGNSLLTINAIDGSIINPIVGY